MTESQARAAGWLRFAEVKDFVPDGQKLYRSSAPGYKKLPNGDHDASQKLTDKAVEFLVKIGIDSVISFNKYPYKPAEIAKLENLTSKIAYKHFPVDDFSAPTFQQLMDANKFFVGKKSTLVHCGYGHGRTGTGVSGLQIGTTNGQTREPFAKVWCSREGGNFVEKRRQMSVLAELRSVLLQNRIEGVPDVGPGKNFVIVNFATGYYLTVSRDNKSLIALSPETVEHGYQIKRQYLWIINKDNIVANALTLSNCVTSRSFVTTKSSGANVDDPMNNGTKDGVNALFTITEVSGDVHGLYVISPSPNANLVMAIKEPDDSRKYLNQSKEMPALLAAKNDNNKFGLWILLPDLSTPRMRY